MSKTSTISNVDKEVSKRKSKLLNVDTSCYDIIKKILLLNCLMNLINNY